MASANRCFPLLHAHYSTESLVCPHLICDHCGDRFAPVATDKLWQKHEETSLAAPDISRRTLLQGAGGVAFVGFSAWLLTQFDAEGKAQTPQSCPSEDLSAEQKELIISNWQAYIDPPAKKNPAPTTIDDFEAETGISVKYTEDVTDNNDFYAKVQNQLGACQTVKRDMFMLTDWMAAKMIELGWIQQLDHANIPNLKNLLPNLQDVAFDPGRQFSVPWQSGFTGIAYNAEYVDEVGSFEELLHREDLKGGVTLLTEMRDTMGFMLATIGADPGDFNKDEWADAIDELEQARSRGQIRAFTGNEYTQDLAAGNILACEAWSGDVIQLQFENENIKFVVPEEGLALWSDNMMVPNLSNHKTNAEEWINFYYDPANAAKLAAWVNYICPVVGAREEMEKIDPSLVDLPLIFPTDDFLANTFAFMPLTEAQSQQYELDFQAATGG
jgi:spermidine/putrescine transport system substrate-binding protein